MEKNEVDTPTYDSTQTVPLAYHEMCMTREMQKIKWILCGWVLSILAAVGIFAYMWLQYDYVSTTDATGIYVVLDSQGNVISADLTAEEMLNLLKEMHSGENTGN